MNLFTAILLKPAWLHYSNGPKINVLAGLFILYCQVACPLIACGQIHDKQWHKTLGGDKNDYLSTIIETKNGGYLLAGFTASSKGGDISEVSLGRVDYWIVRIDSTANKPWYKRYKDASSDELLSAIQTHDSGVLLGDISDSGKSEDKSQDTIGRDSVQTIPAIYSTLTARKYKIALTANKRLVATSLDSLKGNTLYCSGKNGRKHEVSTELLKEVMVAKKKRPVGRGILIGILGGATTGALIGFVSYQEPEAGSWSIDFGPGFAAGAGAITGFLGGAIAGTIIGAASNQYIHYDFSNVPPSGRAILLSRILSGQTR